MLKHIESDKPVLFAMLDDWFDAYGLKVVMITILEWIGRKA